jgi:hypothetical protein
MMMLNCVKQPLTAHWFIRLAAVFSPAVSLFIGLVCTTGFAQHPDSHTRAFSELFHSVATAGDRMSGSNETRTLATQIEKNFRALGHKHVGAQHFSTPVRTKTVSRLTFENSQTTINIDPFLSNAISPDTIGGEGLIGHLVHVGKGEISDFNNKRIKGAVVLMDIDSKGNWLNALSLGAKAVIYLYDGLPDKYLFTDKIELSPVNFPRFIVPRKKMTALIPPVEQLNQPEKPFMIKLQCDLVWKEITARNIYCLIEGVDDTLNEELLIIEGFYDIGRFVPGNAPGADQACSIVTLLDLARHFKDHPPLRSIMLVATAGHSNGLAGMREFIWAVDARSRQFKKIMAKYKKTIETSRQSLEILNRYLTDTITDGAQSRLFQENLHDVIKTRIDGLSNQLMQLRLDTNPNEEMIKHLAEKRMRLKRLEGKTELSVFSKDDHRLARQLIPDAVARQKNILADTLLRKDHLSSSMALKKRIKRRKKQIIISLHLSSHGEGIGAFNEGWLYDIKPAVNVFAPYVKLNNVLIEQGKSVDRQMNLPGFFKDTLRPSLQQSWQSYFKDTPALGGEVSRLAGFLGVTFVTANDARQFWGTPFDTIDRVDINQAALQSRYISLLLSKLSAQPDLQVKRLPRNGFATLSGRANFLRHGAVFADAPAPDSVIMSFQGPAIFYNMADQSGDFTIKGAVTKNLTLHKVILEGYKFDPLTGRTIWAIDKKKTTKDRYRVKMINPHMETDLIMFACRQTTLLNLLEPRNFGYMTKIQLFDARVDATPIRYWWSRIDTRSSLLASIYLQPGTRFKLALSDTLLTKKLILTHADKAHPSGNGYRIDDTPTIAPTQYLAAKDMWALLTPRIVNLEDKGINNQKIKDLQIQGTRALDTAQTHLANMAYDQFFKASGNALALAGRVYDHVESIQKDVLYGVLFYILLFAPFAFCLERLVFAFINIYKRIAGFIGILIALIAIIYNVHPAFDLAYSPVVVILAFFILGLSATVTWIIFHHFENEMKRFQQQGNKANDGEISLLKAFSASFFMGINNLRRRRVRTALTCTTLIILTFTIMSFTSVKSMRQHSRLQYNDTAPYQGLLIKQINWNSLPENAFKVIQNTMAGQMIAAPRAWLENENRTQATSIPVASETAHFSANAMLGLSAVEPEISHLSRLITKGRWFAPIDRYTIIIPEHMAERLNLSDIEKTRPVIQLWSLPFEVIGTFSGQAFDQFNDLDGEPITPAIFPDEVFQQTTDAEMDAMESGDEVKAFQSRYKHIPFDQTVIIPYATLMSLGGQLKSVALKYLSPPADNSTAFKLVDRFGLWLFSGEKNGVFAYSASDNLTIQVCPNVMIPILISIFIVLNTMIGSVQERKREIGIYTSIGMAPSHVSIIFIAEALAYAVLSVVLGYILAQVIVKVFAGTALLNGLTVNYSSLGGVFAMALVMLVVLLSSIYPSKVAASIAIPDVEKSWGNGQSRGGSAQY